MRRIIGKRKVAAATLEIVKSGRHYDQGSWFSRTYFEGKDDKIASAGELRMVFEKNICGTTACVAGNVVVLTLHKDDKYDWRQDRILFADGTSSSVDTYAQGVLELGGEEADWLFSSNRTVEDVTEALDLLAAGESITDLVNDNDDDRCGCGCCDN